jgi:Skp family chaperone for outer membrane proteins
MKKLFLVYILFFFSLCNVVNAETNIVYIDIEKVISVSLPGSSILKQLSDLKKKNSEYFMNIEKNIKKKENKIISQKNIISEIEFNSSIDKLKIEIKDYNTTRSKTIDDFNGLKLKNTNKFLKMIDQIIVNFSKEKSISLILHKKNLVTGKTELDISDDIINIINSEIKEFKIK